MTSRRRTMLRNRNLWWSRMPRRPPMQAPQARCRHRRGALSPRCRPKCRPFLARRLTKFCDRQAPPPMRAPSSRATRRRNRLPAARVHRRTAGRPARARAPRVSPTVRTALMGSPRNRRPVTAATTVRVRRGNRTTRATVARAVHQDSRTVTVATTVRVRRGNRTTRATVTRAVHQDSRTVTAATTVRVRRGNRTTRATVTGTVHLVTRMTRATGWLNQRTPASSRMSRRPTD